MKYYAARALKTGDGWHWTCQHGSSGPVTVCECCLNCVPHRTSQEAQECALDYFIKHRTVVPLSYAQPCSYSGIHCTSAVKLGVGLRHIIPLDSQYIDNLPLIRELYLKLHGLPGEIASSY